MGSTPSTPHPLEIIVREDCLGVKVNVSEEDVAWGEEWLKWYSTSYTGAGWTVHESAIEDPVLSIASGITDLSLARSFLTDYQFDDNSVSLVKENNRPRVRFDCKSKPNTVFMQFECTLSPLLISAQKLIETKFAATTELTVPTVNICSFKISQPLNAPYYAWLPSTIRKALIGIIIDHRILNIIVAYASPH